MCAVLIFVLIVISQLRNEQINAEDSLIAVNVEQGWLEGEVLDSITGEGKYFSFKGIPYAAPPVGKLRFQPPQPSLPWEGVKKATKDGSICVQKDALGNNVKGNEDCLYLNVYSTDLNPENLMPVMFFIHGGGFFYGSGSSEMFGPDFLVPHDVVLVTINYRLGAFGFFPTEFKEIPGNVGLKDQVAALKWVKKNIKAFGGDLENITIFGQSAGAASVILHMISPLSKGLFKRAISMSGVPSCDWVISYQNKKRGFEVGKYLGLNTYNETELYNFLLDIPADKLSKIQPNIVAIESIMEGIINMLYYVPVVEKHSGLDRFLTEDPMKALKNGNINQVDLLIGHTNAEGIYIFYLYGDTNLKKYSQYRELLVPRKILYYSTPEENLKLSDVIIDHYFGNQPISNNTSKEFVKYLTEATYSYDVYKNVEILDKVLQKNMFVYIFSKVSKLNDRGNQGVKYNLTGAGHEDDLGYLFAGYSNFTKHEVDVNSKEYEMIQQVTKLYTNFAKYGNPTPNTSLGAMWPVYNNDTKAFLDIGDCLTPGKALHADVAEFWNTIFDKV